MLFVAKLSERITSVATAHKMDDLNPVAFMKDNRTPIGAPHDCPVMFDCDTLRDKFENRYELC
jgi:hypothetical protein